MNRSSLVVVWAGYTLHSDTGWVHTHSDPLLVQLYMGGVVQKVPNVVSRCHTKRYDTDFSKKLKFKFFFQKKKKKKNNKKKNLKSRYIYITWPAGTEVV